MKSVQWNTDGGPFTAQTDLGYWLQGSDDPYKIVRRDGAWVVIDWAGDGDIVAGPFDSLKSAQAAYLVLI